MIIDIKVPPIGESITEVTLSAWLVEEGDYVEMDQPIAELESDKATLELPAEKAGTVQFVASEGDDIPIGGMVCKIDTSAETTSSKPTSEAPKEEQKEQPAESKQPSNQASSSYASGHASPAAQKILAEKDIDQSAITGTGVGGRITKEDAVKAKKQESSSSAKTESSDHKTIPGERGVYREKMSRLRRTIAAHLVHAKNDGAMLTTFNEVDLTEIMSIRKKYKEPFKEKHEIGLGFMSFFSKACAMALLEFPAVNAQLDEDHILYHDFVDISVAVSTPRGLVTPVVRNVETMDLKRIEKSIKELAIKGRDNKLKLADLEGGTFTISNGGVFGSLLSTPIINAPQTAILGMHKIQQRPMVINGEVQARPMMYLALSYDHRIIDGKEAVTFLVRVKELLEDPIRLLLNV